jgi:hypothetical protein
MLILSADFEGSKVVVLPEIAGKKLAKGARAAYYIGATDDSHSLYLHPVVP